MSITFDGFDFLSDMAKAPASGRVAVDRVSAPLEWHTWWEFNHKTFDVRELIDDPCHLMPVWTQEHLKASGGPRDFQTSWLFNKINTLCWPSGAARFGYFIGVMTSKSVAALPSSGTLTIDDGTHTRLDVTMNVVTAKSLTYREDHNPTQRDLQQLWLVLLADSRFLWQRQNIDEMDIGQSTTFAAVIALLETALGITTQYTAPSSDYGSPHTSLSSRYDYAAPMLDAIARSMGTTFVAEFDGTYKLKTVTENNEGVIVGTRRAGDRQDTYIRVPSTVDVIFTAHGPSKYPHRRHKESVTHNTAVAGIQGLTFAQHNDIDGSTVTLYTTAQANYDEDGNQTNAAQVTTCATALAEFYYASVGHHDMIFNGIIGDIPHNGFWDRLLFEHTDERDISTRIVTRGRYPWTEWHFNSFNVDNPPWWGCYAKLGDYVVSEGGYEWEEHEHVSGNTFAKVTNGLESGGDGDAEALAYEMNSSSTTLTGKYVWMQYGVENQYVFQYEVGGTGEWFKTIKVVADDSYTWATSDIVADQTDDTLRIVAEGNILAETDHANDVLHLTSKMFAVLPTAYAVHQQSGANWILIPTGASGSNQTCTLVPYVYTDTGTVSITSGGKISTNYYGFGGAAYYAIPWAQAIRMHPENEPWTWTLWWWKNSGSSGDLPIINWGGGTPTVDLFFDSTGGTVAADFYNNDGSPDTATHGTSISDDTWYWIELFYDPITSTGSVNVNNGTAVTTTVTNGLAWIGSGNDLNIGFDGTNYMDGRMDQVSQQNALLTSAMQTERYNSGSGFDWYT